MTTIRKTRKGIIIEEDGYSPFYNACVQGASVYKVWIAKDLWDKVAVKLNGNYTDPTGEKFTVNDDHLDNYLRLTDDILEYFVIYTPNGTAKFPYGKVRFLESRTIQ